MIRNTAIMSFLSAWAPNSYRLHPALLVDRVISKFIRHLHSLNSMEVVPQKNDAADSRISIRDIVVFSTIFSLAAILHFHHNQWGYFPFMGAIYFAGWRLLNINISRTNRIVMMALAIAIVSPLLLWYSSPETRAFNTRIGYQWSGSYLYPFFSLLPIPYFLFIWKCFRPKITTLRYMIESCCECLVLIPLYTIFVLGM